MKYALCYLAGLLTPLIARWLICFLAHPRTLTGEHADLFWCPVCRRTRWF